MTPQTILSASILSRVRFQEKELLMTRGIEVELCHVYRSDHSQLPTPRRKHKITDRHARKVAARAVARTNFHGEAKLFKHYHSAQRLQMERDMAETRAVHTKARGVRKPKMAA